MGRYLTSEQVRDASIAAMGPTLGELHYQLGNEVAWVHMKWQEYRLLFGTDKLTIDLLNEAAPAYFHYLQGILWDDVLLHLSRLTDPAKSVGKENLSLECLAGAIENLQLKEAVRALVERARGKAAFARDWRNRRIAHKALPSGPTQESVPLAHASRQTVEGALAAIREVMNHIEDHFQDAPVAYEHFIEPPGGASCLLLYLKKGVEAQRREDEALLRLKTGRSG